MESEIKTVVDGEASESDEEEEEEVEKGGSVPATEQTPTNAVSVSGEAPESDEEEEGEETNPIPPLRVESGPKDDLEGSESKPAHRLYSSKPKFDSLLHKKLREKNVTLRRHLVDSIHQMYLTSAKDLHNTSLQLHKSKAMFADLSHNMKNLTNDLFYLEDKVDIITSCQILPEVNIPVERSTASTASSSS
ncbi:uncharacterized protein LOC111099582 [Crassostrea virginica]|uniref:Biogenesis of lysosome-related organelles complex 1 subunit 3 n=1 Tax=Crassostrea virginica TaxID=6565 RepID=A0A8B8A9Q8_CRAVI|nr:uncharacterized protein LOC111099582 [Crassostrea virginica]